MVHGPGAVEVTMKRHTTIIEWAIGELYWGISVKQGTGEANYLV